MRRRLTILVIAGAMVLTWINAPVLKA